MGPVPDKKAAENPIQRLIILGHGGFIGVNIARFFREHSPELEICGKDFPELDLTHPESSKALAPLFDRNTAIVVCAAIKKQLGDNLDAFSNNVHIATNLCRALAARPVGRILFFSSAAVYGEDVHNTRITEETPVQPVSYYGLAKFVSEGLLRKAALQSQSSLVILRPALVYGPGDQGGYGPTGFIKSALKGEPIVLWGDGTERREFVYVEDVAKIVHALTFEPFEGVLNVASGTSYTYQDVLRVVRHMVGFDKPVDSQPRTKNQVDHGFDCSRLRSLLPGFRFTGLSEGMNHTAMANRAAVAVAKV